MLLEHPDIVLQRAANLPDDSLVVPVAKQELARRADVARAEAAALELVTPMLLPSAVPRQRPSSTSHLPAPAPRTAGAKAAGAASGMGTTRAALRGATGEREGVPSVAPAGEAPDRTPAGTRQPAYLKWLNKPQKRNACIMRLCCFGGAVSGVQYTPDGMRIGSSHEVRADPLRCTCARMCLRVWWGRGC